MINQPDNCFYCQNLSSNYHQGGQCQFCDSQISNNHLYGITHQRQTKYFCCGCAWWQLPRSKIEQETEKQWYQNWQRQRYQSFLSQQLIQCEHCGGKMTREFWGFKCCNCEKFLTKEKIRQAIYYEYF